ncbi:MAG: UDP-N-acetylglucosamine 2-epimerase (non-hydrolyzing) [Pseudonocardiales bacterium]|nr:MAG: UDP-N-acetylglucosamine 2-epimerase (non-hydrolyzing) [Pseudonocardiales bacterium]
MFRIAVVLGTRPEIIKLAGVIDGLGDAAVVIHTGQHYDDGLSQVFLDGLGLAAPAYRVELGGLSRAEQIGRGTTEVAALLGQLAPHAVIVQGDTNSALAGALAANATGLPLVHVEAGLRSYDRAMPEEHNRVLVDHLSDLLAAPTPAAVGNLAREGIAGAQVICCGNTVVEAVARQLPGPPRRAELLREYGLRRGEYVLATLHRPENTDDPAALARILTELGSLPLPVLLPLHPRTAAAARAAGIDALLEALRVVPPMDGSTFLGLAAEAAVLVSDSGGVQEEVTILGRPLVVVRRSTERPEAFEHHATLVGPATVATAVNRYLADLARVHRDLEARPSPFGDGTASEAIVRELHARFGSSARDVS